MVVKLEKLMGVLLWAFAVPVKQRGQVWGVAVHKGEIGDQLHAQFAGPASDHYMLYYEIDDYPQLLPLLIGMTEV